MVQVTRKKKQRIAGVILFRLVVHLALFLCLSLSYLNFLFLFRKCEQGFTQPLNPKHHF